MNKSTKIHNIIKQIRETSSKLDKIKILKSSWECDGLQQYLKLVYDDNFKLGVKQEFDFVLGGTECLISQLDKVIQINDSGKKSKAKWTKFFAQLDFDSQQLFNYILKGNVRAGFDIESLNKVEPDFIYQVPFLLAQSYKDKTRKHVKFPAVVQAKSDGMRVSIIYNNDEAQIWTRGNNRLDFRIECIALNELKRLNVEPCVLDGELVFYEQDNITPLARKTSNGLSNKCVHGTISDEELKTIHIHLWDVIETENFVSKDSYSRDYYSLIRRLSHLIENSIIFNVLATYVVNSHEEITELYNEHIARGEEGIMVKNIVHEWGDKRSNDILKVKEVSLNDGIELVAIEFLPGDPKSKYANVLGSIRGINKELNIDTYVGTGFTDKDRETIWRNRRNLLNEVFEVNCNELIQSRDSDTKSMFLPVFSKWRPEIKM